HTDRRAGPTRHSSDLRLQTAIVRRQCAGPRRRCENRAGSGSAWQDTNGVAGEDFLFELRHGAAALQLAELAALGAGRAVGFVARSEEHTSELKSRFDL